MALRTAMFSALAAHGFAQSCSGDACDLEETGLMQVKNHAGADSGFGPIPTHAPTPAPEPPQDKKIVVGAIKTVFHNVSGWVYALALEQYGMDYQMVDVYGHYELYPMFTGHGGAPDHCEEEGCADLCRAQGLGSSPCIDLLVSSQVPGTHSAFLINYTDEWAIQGTAFEYWQQTLYAPAYAGIKNLADAAKSETISKEILGFETGNTGQGCAAMYCPACPGADGVPESNFPYIYGLPLNESGFTFKLYPCEDYTKLVESKLRKNETFLTYGWALSPWQSIFPLLSEVQLVGDGPGQNYRDYSYYIPRKHMLNMRTPGKAIIRNAAKHKFPSKVLQTLSAIFIGNQGVNGMCHEAVTGKLCDTESWDSACAKEAAQKWINQNNVTDGEGPAGVVNQYGFWPSFFGFFQEGWGL